MAEKKIKILLIHPFFYPHKGGSERYAEEILSHTIKRHKEVKVDVLCYNTDKTVGYEEYRGMRIFRIPCWNIIPSRFTLARPIPLLIALVRLSKNRYHFVNTHIRFFDPTWWAWIYAKIIGAKSIFTGHVPSHPTHQYRFIEFTARLVDLSIAKLSLRFFDHIFFVNRASQIFFEQELGVRRKTDLLYIGTDTNFFSIKNAPKTRKIPKINKQVDKNAIVITYVGRLIHTKGVIYLYNAAKTILKKTNKPVYFVLAGPGELEKPLRERILNDNLSNNVLLTGSLAYSQVRDLLTISDIFINPSHHNEGLPNTILEAGACGAFVIATDNGATKEIVKNMKTGILIPQRNPKALVNSINWAINNVKERNRISKNMTKLIRNKFDWDALSEQFYNYLKGNR